MIFNSPYLACGVSAKPQNMSFIYGATEGTLENRRVFLNTLGIDHERLIAAKQIHGITVCCAQEENAGRGAKSAATAFEATDAFITNTKNLPLSVFTADCLSVFLYDPVKSVAGIVHAGWRGAKEGIAAKTILMMYQRYNSAPQDILAGFGPCLKKCCYEVGAEFSGHFSYGLDKVGSSFYLDLPAINKKQLLEAGLKEENIDSDNDCTACCNDRYFSFRKEKEKAGRMMSVIMLR